jgi:phosphatidylethanolamine/phosphatidyl-N-methylethanolamine N-methyltransferase
MQTDYLDTKKVEKVYSLYSSCYDVLFGRLFHHSRAAAINRLELQPGSRVLEVGVGTGLSLPLYPRDCRVVGVDLTGRMLARGVRRVKRHGLAHVQLQRQDAARLAFRDNSFDAVMAAYVISTVPDPKRVLAEMSRVCRPNGVIVLLNHFATAEGLLADFERSVSPLCRWIGFRSYLSLDTLLQETYLAVQSSFRVNPFRYWHVIQCVNRKPAHAFIS